MNVFAPTRLFPRFHQWVHRHPRRTIVLFGLGLLIASACIAFGVFYRAPEKIAPIVKQETKPAPAKYYSLMDGTEVSSQAATTLPVTAVMIENSPEARPQSGIKEAQVVYEAIAEGGITRFLALYQQSKPNLVGPVRSLRMYYIDWLAPYQASAAHIGGSAAALAEIRNGTYRDIDQFFNTGSYWRANDRYAPHNVYTNFERLDALNAAKGYTNSSFTSMSRAQGKPLDQPTASTVNILFGSSTYNTRYVYDKNTNTYLREVGGAAHTDREKGTITPTSVIAMSVDMTTVMEDGYRQSVQTTGSGKAVVFQNGEAIECLWSKADRMAPLTLADANGKPITLNRGQTWIAAVPNGRGGVAWE